MVPLVPLEDLYSSCAVATIGHDFPQRGDPQGGEKPGKPRMKILAGAPGAPIFKCMLDRIIENVSDRAYPENYLALTGLSLLHECYLEHSEGMAISYHDTRNAEWPYHTGMRAGNKVLVAPTNCRATNNWEWKIQTTMRCSFKLARCTENPVR
jgi:hypothetical protein